MTGRREEGDVLAVITTMQEQKSSAYITSKINILMHVPYVTRYMLHACMKPALRTLRSVCGHNHVRSAREEQCTPHIPHIVRHNACTCAEAVLAVSSLWASNLTTFVLGYTTTALDLIPVGGVRA